VLGQLSLPGLAWRGRWWSGKTHPNLIGILDPILSF
jgi:hypothetical protein